MQQNNKALTKFPEGSMRELWSISLPLMISSLASLLMLFVDRCFLARYSLDALNASVNGGTLAWAFLGGMGMLTVMSEVFVAQYNGAEMHKKIGVPVWQMIWVSIFSALIFIPIGLWFGSLFFQKTAYLSMQIDYFKYLMLFGPFYCISTALAGFFIGRGRTRILIYLGIFSNVINVIFDWIMIFGIKGIFPEMGIKGAAIATGIGTIFQTVILAYIFLKKVNRESFGSDKWHFNFDVFKKCLKVGSPPAIFYTLEIFGWALFFVMMTQMSEVHITISSICQSIVLLLSFFFDGMTRGVSALAGNFIGSKRIELIHSLLKSSLKLLVVFIVLVSVFLIFDPKLIVDFLIPGNMEKHVFLWQNIDGHSFYYILKTCLVCVFIYTFFEGIRWIFAGLLTSAGDTMFLLIAGSLSVWCFLILPVYLIVVKLSLSVQYAWILASLYAIFLSLIYWLRFRNGKWKEIQLIAQTNSSEAEE
ncbi:MAG: MATE family efflux transporter [Parachlamydiales bacterium]